MSEHQTTDWMRVPDLVRYTGIPASSWAKRRLSGDTPEFVRVGRSILYSRSAVDDWLAKRRHRSTSDNLGVAA